MRNTTFKGALAALTCAVLPLMKANAQAFTEDFNDITTLTASGWVMTNASAAVGSTGWFQGNTATFSSYNGAANAYIGANYNNTGSVGTISNWLMTPNRTFRNGDVIAFYTRQAVTTYADRLQVRLSTNGASTVVGTGTGVGDYTTLLLDINPTYSGAGYPEVWTLYTITLSGLPAPTSGRIALRYFVENAGLNGTTSDYIGIDNVVYTPYTCPAFTMTPGGALTGGTAGGAYSTSLTQTGALGAPSYAVTAGALPPGLTLSASGTISGTPTATGTFNFTVTVSDASGCSGSTAYSITTVCGPNPTSLNGLPTLCSADSPETLTQGSPAGGTYSGTGVTGATFDPAAGTQTITYDYTDPYGCPYSTSATITVNTTPTVTQDPLTTVCDNAGTVALSGGSPAGGAYSGTGVTGSDFDPASGTQTITYTYTDANGCAASASTTQLVNAAPIVSQAPYNPVCDNFGPIALTSGTPAGGTYTGTGVIGTGAMFDPTAGTQTINYAYTDANGCSNNVDFTITVNTAPTVTQDPLTAVCEDAGTVTLTGGSPAGGAYSGVGVTGTNFNPSAGTQTITYTYTDANSCTNTATATQTVNPLPSTALTLSTDEYCVYNNAATLAGGSPAGGSYSGPGVTGGSFNPATAGVGMHTITYDYTDGNGCSATATDIMHVDACLGVEEATEMMLTAYPNPGNGLFTIALSADQQLTAVQVFDVQGKVVERVNAAQQGNLVTVDLTAANNGIYILQGTLNGQHVSVRLIKQ